MRHAAGLERGIAEGLYADLADGVAEAVLEEAGKFPDDRIAPLNRAGDKETSRLVDGKVVVPTGFTGMDGARHLFSARSLGSKRSTALLRE